MSDYSSSTSHRKPEPAKATWGAVPPDAYVRTYGRLEQVSNDSYFRDLFHGGAGTHSVPLVSRSSIEIFPGMYSFDEPVLDFQRSLVSVLNKELPVDVDDEGFSKHGVYTSFDRLKCPAGFLMNPMSYVAVDNSKYREELGLRVGMQNRERAIMRELYHIAFGDILPHSVNVPKLSTGGMRRWTRDVQWKLAFAEYLFVPETFERMLNAVEADDHLTLANEFETAYAFYLQKRGQVDMPGKERRVVDLAYARSGGLKGSEFASDKNVVFADGRKYPDFSAIRARVVQAGPWSVNCFLQIIATCTMHSLFARFPGVFHVNTPEEISEQVNGDFVFCSDVKEYDRSMDADEINEFHDVMQEYWDPRIVKSSRKLYFAPYYSKPLEMGGRRGAWVGDPRDPDSLVKGGNRSGHAMTSLMAKLNKVGETLIVIDKQTPVLGRVKSFLEKKGVMKFINNGDDEIVHTSDETAMKIFMANRANLDNGRYVVEPEVGQGFSGSLLTRQSKTDRTYVPVAKIHTTFEKLWVPERAIGGKHRPFWTIGVIDRISNVTKTDTGRHAWNIAMSEYRRMLAPVYGDFLTTLMREHAKIKLDLERLNAKDREVLDDPSKLHYKYVDAEISSKVLKEVTTNIPLNVVDSFIKRYYRK